MRIRSVDFIFMLLMFFCAMISFVGVFMTEGVQQRPFVVMCPLCTATLVYLAFRVEIGDKLK